MNCNCDRAPICRHKKIQGHTFPYFFCPKCLKVEYRRQDLDQIRQLEKQRDASQPLLNCG